MQKIINLKVKVMEERKNSDRRSLFAKGGLQRIDFRRTPVNFRMLLFICVLLVPSTKLFSQSDIAQFLKAGKADANSLIEAYLNPYANAFGDGLNMGWYNSAKTHKLGGLDLAVMATAIQIPSSAQTFDINSINFQKLTLADPDNHFAPTVAGAKQPGPKLLVKNTDGSTAFSFNTPEGVGLDIIPVPMVQLTFGILPHTDVIGRLVPELKYNNDGDQTKVGFWGIGLKHNFMNWVPVLKDLPFDASFFGSISQLDGQSDLTLTPQDYDEPSAIVSYNDTNDQALKLKTKTSRYGLVVSKKIGVLTLFGGIGHNSSETSIDVLGKYPVLTNVNGQMMISDDNAIYDPVAVSFKTKNICLDAGLRIKLAFFSIFGSINKSEYTSYTTGISLGFR